MGTKLKIESIIDFTMEKVKGEDNKGLICCLCTAQFINYYIDKGIFNEFEKKELCEYSIKYIQKKYVPHLPLEDWVYQGLVNKMMSEKSYNYEDLIYPITKLLTKNK